MKVTLRAYKGFEPLFLGMGELIYGNPEHTVTVTIKNTDKPFDTEDEKIDFLVKEAFSKIKEKIDTKQFDVEMERV